MTADASAGVLLLDHSDVLVTVKRSFYDLYFGLLVFTLATWQGSCTSLGYRSYSSAVNAALREYRRTEVSDCVFQMRDEQR